MSGDASLYTITVLCRDRVGIIADATETLFQLGANLQAMSQTVVWGWFTMIICAKFPADVEAPTIRAALEDQGGFVATVLPFLDEDPPFEIVGEPFIATVAGEDKPGIVRLLTRCLAAKGVNIDDVWNEVNGNWFTVIFRLTLPPHVDPTDVRYDMEKAATEMGVAATLQHQDIFTAINSLAVHTPRRPDHLNIPYRTL